MQVTPVSGNLTTSAVAAQQQQTSAAVQVEMLREISDSQQQIAQMLTEMGLGQNLDVLA
jgi:5-hydroxyisourate hydrolase-like protein (transthyretin family)